MLRVPDFEGESKCWRRNGGVLVASPGAGKVHPYNATTTSQRTNAGLHSAELTRNTSGEPEPSGEPTAKIRPLLKAWCDFVKTKREKLTTKKK